MQFVKKGNTISAWLPGKTALPGMRGLLKLNLKTVRAYLLKEDLGRFWGYKTAGWAARFLDDWCRRILRSRLTPMKKVARMLRSHRELLLNWFRAKGRRPGRCRGSKQQSESDLQKSVRYGYRSFDVLKIALWNQRPPTNFAEEP